MRILVINPGSTSTKIAVFEDEKPLFVHNIHHEPEELAKFDDVIGQRQWRKQLVLNELEEHGIPAEFDAVVGRGGLTKPIEGGVYGVNDAMLDDMEKVQQHHASDLGCLIAHEIAAMKPGTPSFVADPVTVDELNEYARISGTPLLPRVSIWHALNQRATARRYAKEVGCKYEDLNLIICHLGGGISVAAHEHGRAVDVNNALNGEGPFTPERAGTLPAGPLIKLCFSGKYTQQELLTITAGKGGLSAHLGTNNALEVERAMAAGDAHAKLVFDAMIYHVAKSIAAQGAVLCGKVDAILLTGGIAHSPYLCDELKRRVGYLAPVHVYAGEDEMGALALNALAVLRGERSAKEYK